MFIQITRKRIRGENMVQNEELMHYGVVGMKWGVRHNPSAAYAKAVKKQNKLNDNIEKARVKSVKADIKARTGVAAKYQKLQTKADKAQYKADKKKYGFFSNKEKAEALQEKADRAQYKADKYKYRAEKRLANASEAKGEYMRAQRKAEKWAKTMEKTFREMDVASLNEEAISKGMKYTKKLAS